MTQYDAFISYRRSDGRRVANWIRQALQTFKAPRSMPALRSRRLKVYLDTAYETGTVDFYERNIRPALLASRFFVVVATPDALVKRDAGTDWIERELADFAAGPNGANVLAVRGAGELTGRLPADLDVRYPNIEIIDLRDIGWATSLNPLRAGRLSAEKLKLIAPLLDLPPDAMPALRLEDERRQQRRLGAALGVTVAVVTLTAGASVFAFRSLWRAQQALESSMFSTGRIISTLADTLPADSDPYGMRGSLLNEACDLSTKLAREARKAPRVREQVLCHIERARARETNGEMTEAIAALEAAVSLAASEEARDPSVANGGALVEASEALAGLVLRAGQTDAAKNRIAELIGHARRLSDLHADTTTFPVAEARAYLMQRAFFKGREGTAARIELIQQAANRIADAERRGESKPQTVASLAEWRADLLRQMAVEHWEASEFPAALRELREAVAVRQRMSKLSWDSGKSIVDPATNGLSIVELLIAISALERHNGNVAAARSAKAESVTQLAQISVPKGNLELERRQEELRRRLDALVL